MGQLNISIPGVKTILNELNKVNDLAMQAERHTLSDIKSRANTWVAQAVTSVYNINKNDIKWDRAKTNIKAPRKAGKIFIKADSIDNVSITYSGHLLSPVRFGMTPTAPTGDDYTLSMSVYKGKRKVIGRYKAIRSRGGPYAEKTGGILMPTGAISPDKTQYIPFKRQSRYHKDIIKFQTVAIPQMIDNKTVRERIQANLIKNVNKRLQHNIARFNTKPTVR